MKAKGMDLGEKSLVATVCGRRCSKGLGCWGQKGIPFGGWVAYQDARAEDAGCLDSGLIGGAAGGSIYNPIHLRLMLDRMLSKEPGHHRLDDTISYSCFQYTDRRVHDDLACEIGTIEQPVPDRARMLSTHDSENDMRTGRDIREPLCIDPRGRESGVSRHGFTIASLGCVYRSSNQCTLYLHYGVLLSPAQEMS